MEKGISTIQADLDQKDAEYAVLQTEVALLKNQIGALLDKAQPAAAAALPRAGDQAQRDLLGKDRAIVFLKGLTADLRRQLEKAAESVPAAIPANHKVNCVQVHEVAGHDCNATDYAYYSRHDHFHTREAIKLFKKRGDVITNADTVCEELDVHLYPKRGEHDQVRRGPTHARQPDALHARWTAAQGPGVPRFDVPAGVCGDGW